MRDSKIVNFSWKFPATGHTDAVKHRGLFKLLSIVSLSFGCLNAFAFLVHFFNDSYSQSSFQSRFYIHWLKVNAASISFFTLVLCTQNKVNHKHRFGWEEPTNKKEFVKKDGFVLEHYSQDDDLFIKNHFLFGNRETSDAYCWSAVRHFLNRSDYSKWYIHSDEQ